MRRCFVTGERRDKEELIRFVTGPDGFVTPDLANDLPGRGYYLTARRDILERAIEKRLFGRGARAAVKTPDGLAEVVEFGLQRRCLDLIGLANRSGQAVAGYEKVRRAVKDGQAVVLFTAADAGADGLRRARSLKATEPEMTEINIFNATTLGTLFGRDICVHVAVTFGGLAERLRREAARLAAFSVGRAGDDSG